MAVFFLFLSPSQTSVILLYIPAQIGYGYTSRDIDETLISTDLFEFIMFHFMLNNM